jgi:hypothetical protein
MEALEQAHDAVLMAMDGEFHEQAKAKFKKLIAEDKAAARQFYQRQAKNAKGFAQRWGTNVSRIGIV